LSFFSSLSAAISAGIKALGDGLANLAAHIKPLVIATGEELGQAALAAVLQHAPLVMTGQEKLDSAIATVKTGLAAQGKSAALTVIQSAIQEAYDELSRAIHPPQ